MNNLRHILILLMLSTIIFVAGCSLTKAHEREEAKKILEKLASDNEFERERAMSEYPYHPGTIPGLVKRLGYDNELVREGAIETIARMNSGRSPGIVKAFKSRNLRIRQGIFEALSRKEYSDDSYLLELKKAFENETDAVSRLYIIRAIGIVSWMHDDAIPILLQGLDEQNREARYEAAIGIAYHPYKRTQDIVEILTEALGSADPYYRVKAASRLELTGPGAHTAIPALIENLNDNNEEVRFATAFAIASIDPTVEEILPVLIAAAGSDDYQTRVKTLHKFVHIGIYPDEALPNLIAILHGDHTMTTYEYERAFEALANIGPTVIPLLIKAFSGSHHEMARRIKETLNLIGPDAVPLLVDALESGNPDIRLWVIYTLRGIYKGWDMNTLQDINPLVEDIIPLLEEIAENDEDEATRNAARDALKTIN